MYLKSLELHGFKSFAQKTVLEFLPSLKDRHSIMAIVGPNGAGKSNIVDAIRWVMGEQSMKTLRGRKGEDIIFSGSESKGRMGMAAVTLVLDNKDGRIPIDYEEVSVTRRYYRSGESEYLINGSSVRLFDLQILLAKAQFGQGTYSIIGQGMIDRLLLQTPTERKDFFDEACGIKEFQIKRHQSVLKLQHTRENVKQAELLLQEVEPRMRTLSRQVKKLEKRQEVELSLRELQEQYYSTLYHFNQSQLESLHAELDAILKNYNEINNRLASVQDEMSKLAKEESRQFVFAGLQGELQKILQQKNNLEREKAVLQGKLQVEYSQAGKQNIGWLQNKIDSLKGRQTELEKNLSESEALVDKISNDILNQKKKLEALLIERAEIRGKISSLEQKMMQIKSEQGYWQYSGLKAVQAVLEERHKLGNIYGTIAQLGEVEEKYRQAMDVAAGSHLSSIVVDNDRTAQVSIEYLRQQQLGVATFLPLNKIKPRLLAHDIQELKNMPGVHGLAVDLLKFNAKFADIFSYVLGNTLIVENLDVAREIGIGRVRMVTVDGDVVEISGSMKGGYRKRDRQKGLSFAYGNSPYLVSGDLSIEEEELNDWQKKAGQTEIRYQNEQEYLQELQAQAHAAASRASLLGEQKQALDRELAGLTQELSMHSLNADEYSQSLSAISGQKLKLEREIIDLEKAISAVERKISAFNQEEERKKQRIFALQEAMQIEQNKLNAIVDEKNQKQIALAKLETKQEDMANEVFQEMHNSLLSIVEKDSSLLPPESLEEEQQKIQKLKYQLSLIGGIDEEAVQEYQETRIRYESLTTQLADLQKAMQDLEVLIAELDEMMKKKRDRAFKEIKKEFARYFSLLFEGGKGDLVELYGEAGENIDESPDRAEEGAIIEEAEIKPKKKELISRISCRKHIPHLIFTGY